MDIDKIFALCTSDIMSLAELYEDPLFFKIPADKIGQYLAALQDIAREKADQVKTESRALPDICKALGITIHMDNQCAAVAAMPYRAEVLYQAKRIHVIGQSLVQMYDQLKELTFGNCHYQVTQNSIFDIHIAHELYHFMEYTEGEETGSLLPAVTSLKIGWFEKKSTIARASEAAAHLFCMELLELPFHPKLLDYLYLLKLGKVTEESLIRFLESLAKIKAGE